MAVAVIADKWNEKKNAVEENAKRDSPRITAHTARNSIIIIY